MDKRCNRCGVVKEVSLFYANKRMRDGLNTFCIECHKADNVARKARLRKDVEFRAAEQISKQAYRAKTVDSRAEYMRSWRAKNTAHERQYAKAYRTNNKGFINYLSAKRKLALMERTPKWLDSDDLWMIEQAYELAVLRSYCTGIPWNVDHVIPLRGRRVSGLHSPFNLQVIPAKVNRQKTNRFEV